MTIASSRLASFLKFMINPSKINFFSLGIQQDSGAVFRTGIVEIWQILYGFPDRLSICKTVIFLTEKTFFS